MKIQLNLLQQCAAAALLLLGMTNAASAFNQDHFFLYKTVGGLSGVQEIACGPDDKIYVADTNNSRLVIYDKDLNKLTQVSGIYPYGVDVSETGAVYVADPTADKVRKYDSSGNSLGDLTSGFDAYSVHIHPGNGNIYVEDSGGGYRIYKPDGTLVKSFSLPENKPWAVRRDGKLQLSNGHLYNDLGILEKSDLPQAGSYYRGAGLKLANGFVYAGTSFRDNNGAGGGWINVFDGDSRICFSISKSGQYGPYFSDRFVINHQGDVIGAENYSPYQNGCGIYLFRRTEGNSMGPEARNAAPTAEITSLQQRPNSTLLDIDYTVTDLDDAKVQVAAAAFKNNTNDLTNMVLMNSLVENTAQNVGPAITTGTTHRLTWDARADWGVDFGDVSVHIFARDSRPLLMGLHFLSLPASGTNAAIPMTRCPVNQSAFMEPLMWLAASKNPAVSFANAQIKGVGGAFDGQLLASGTTVTQAGRQYIESLMGVREATAAEVKAAREASTPGNVNQWDLDNLTQKIDLAYPQKVNEYGFDTGSYDGTWFWLVKVN